MIASATTQVLDKEQMKNTAWVGIGAPLGGDPMVYGFTDTFQTRFDRGKFTVEAMLNWSFLANFINEIIVIRLFEVVDIIKCIYEAVWCGGW